LEAFHSLVYDALRKFGARKLIYLFILGLLKLKVIFIECHAYGWVWISDQSLELGPETSIHIYFEMYTSAVFALL
jgi:hypothetical protein